ncbi:MAG: hypothetical protein QF463_10905 [Vicinamibacterales bacterium]|jgi:hypothetical protein|nr:hypothetical protein [Acidobacteriota bacterium]MDP6372204.1 hypothetical protein [Vicinamibacterales bacterium]MDP6609563.1 hypothetical protein [Vicinamibacterales bacterium]|tara:strand:+ start:1018 stop:1410 length:393 start_codon:yes stop_codon:yes gene_type:complete
MTEQDDLRAVVEAVAEAAGAVTRWNGPWKRIFSGGVDSHFRHRVGHFLHALDAVLVSHPKLLTDDDMTALRGHGDQVIARLEAELSAGVLERDDKVQIATTVYKINERVEEILMASKRLREPPAPGTLGR